MAFDAVGDLLEIVGRFLFRILYEVLIEFLCKKTGYSICKSFKSDIDPDGFAVTAVGFIFWGGVILLGFYLYDFIQIDK